MKNRKEGKKFGLTDIPVIIGKIMSDPRGKAAAIKSLIWPEVKLGESQLIEYLESRLLKEGETECRIVSEKTPQRTLVWVIGAFEHKKFKRLLEYYTTEQLLDKFLKRM